MNLTLRLLSSLTTTRTREPAEKFLAAHKFLIQVTSQERSSRGDRVGLPKSEACSVSRPTAIEQRTSGLPYKRSLTT